MPIKNEASGKVWYELRDVIKIAQGFGKEGNFTVLPNNIVDDIVTEMERLTELQTESVSNGEDLVSILEKSIDCDCETCKEIHALILKEKGLKE